MPEGNRGTPDDRGIVAPEPLDEFLLDRVPVRFLEPVGPSGGLGWACVWRGEGVEGFSMASQVLKGHRCGLRHQRIGIGKCVEQRRHRGARPA